MKIENVINATSLVSSEIAVNGAQKFNHYAKKTAEAVLEMAKIVSDMKAKTQRWEFEQFCSLIGYEASSGTVRKFLQIGGKYDYLISQADKLPSSWTTIYQISKLSIDQIGCNIDSGLINSQLVGSQVPALLGISSPRNHTKTAVNSNSISNVPNGTLEEYGFRVRLPGIPSNDAILNLKDVFETLKKLNVEVEVGSLLEGFMAESEMINSI